MPGKDKRLKSFEIIDDKSEVDKISSAFVLPLNDQEADLIIIDDIGQERTIRSGGGDKTWVHNQTFASDTWTINHTLNKKVSVTVTDTAGTVIQGQVTLNDTSKVIIQFNFPFSGEAILN